MSRRGRVTIAVLVGVFVLFTLLGWGVQAWTDWLWFDEVRYTEVFTGVLLTRLVLFLAIGLGMAVIVGGNLWLAYRLRPRLRPHSVEQATPGALPDGAQPAARHLDRADRRCGRALRRPLRAEPVEPVAAVPQRR